MATDGDILSFRHVEARWIEVPFFGSLPEARYPHGRKDVHIGHTAVGGRGRVVAGSTPGQVAEVIHDNFMYSDHPL